MADASIKRKRSCDGQQYDDVQNHLLSRVLYTNPVCFLSTVDAGSALNVMTITWFTPVSNRVRDNLMDTTCHNST